MSVTPLEMRSVSTVDTKNRTHGGNSVGSQCKAPSGPYSDLSLLMPSRMIIMRAGKCFFAAAAKNRLRLHRKSSSVSGTFISRSWKKSFSAVHNRNSVCANCVRSGGRNVFYLVGVKIIVEIKTVIKNEVIRKANSHKEKSTCKLNEKIASISSSSSRARLTCKLGVVQPTKC